MENRSLYSTKQKILISIITGLVTFVLSPVGISTQIGNIPIDIPWSLLFPMILSIAFGWRYAGICAISGAALFPFLLWPEDGYANLGNVLMYTAIFCNIGLLYHPKAIKIESSLVKRLIYSIALSAITIFIQAKILLNLLLTINPAFWTSQTINIFPQDVINTILFKDVTTIIFLTIIAETSLKVPIIRKLLGLKEIRAYKQNQKIFLLTNIIAITIWLIFVGLDVALFQDFNPLQNSLIILSFLLILLSGIIVSRAIFHYSSLEFFAKEELRKSEIMFRLLAENSSDIIIRQTLDNTLLYVSPACKTLLGYLPDELIGKSIYELIHPSDSKHAYWPKTAQESSSFNIRLESQNEIYRWFEVYNKIVEIPNSNSRCEIHSSLRDITARVEAEKKLKDSNDMFSDMVMNSPGIIYQYYITHSGVRGFHYISPKAEEILALQNNVNHWTEMNLEQIIHPEDRERFVFEMSDAYLRQATFHFEGRVLTPRGVQWIEVNSRPSLFEDETRYNGIITNITDRKNAENRLIESEERYRRILSGVTDYVYTVRVQDGKPIETKHNDACIAITGYSPDEFVSNPNLWFDMVIEQDRDMVVEKTLKAIQGKLISPFEHKIRCKNGQIRWISNSIISKYDSDQNLIAYDGVIEDITERKLADELIRDSESRFIEMAANVPGIIFQLYVRNNNTKGFYYISPKIEEVIGVQIDIFNFDEVFFKLIHPEDKEIYLQTSQKSISDRREFYFEGRLVTPNGTVWIQIVSHPKVEKEEVIYNGIITNITQRKKAEIALKNLATNYASLSGKPFYEAVCGHIASLLNLDYVFVGQILHATNEVNILGGSALGLLMEEMHYNLNNTPCYIVSNNNICHYVTNVQEQFPEDDLLKAMNIEGYIGIPIIDKKEHVIGILVGLSTRPIEETDNLTSFFNIFVDRISAEMVSQKATEALNESERKLRTLFGSMTEMVLLNELIYDANNQPIDYHIRDCNKAFTEIMGFNRGDVINKKGSEIFQNSTLPFFKDLVNVAISGEPFDYEIYDPKLDKHFMVSAVSPQKNSFATISTDITSLKLIQEAIIEKNKELENYLYITSHDLRTPLVNIQGFSLRLQKQTTTIKEIAALCDFDALKKDEISKIVDVSIPKSLEYIFTNITKMDSLINGLLQISRTGRLKMTINEVSMNQIIDSVIASLNYQITEIGAKISLNELPNCFGDYHLLNQLFSNIVSNAIKYRDENRNLEISITAKTKYNKVIYAVSDNGIGIESRHLSKIWDVFFRVDNQLVGEGLGLSLVKRIIDKHKGKVWVESTFGEGSTFFIELPKSRFSE